jgi:hypothetical protein
MFHRSYNTLERPEAPQPEGDPARPEESEGPPELAPAPAPETESPPEEADAAGGAVGAAAAEPPSTDGPCPCPEAARTTETDAPMATGALGPVVAGESDVERQSKRVATVEPVESGSGAVNAGTPAAHEPADGGAFERGTPDRDDGQLGDLAPSARVMANRWRGPPIGGEPVGGML